MRGVNKLLAPLCGGPLVARAVDAALASRAEAVVVESAAWPNCASPACRLCVTCRPLEVSLIFTLSPCFAQ